MTDRAKKFLFDNNDFSEDALRRKLEATRRPTFSEAQMEAARKSGFEEGRKAGVQETLNSQESQIRDALQQVVIAASQLEQEETKRFETFIEQSALLTAHACTRTLPILLDHLAVEQIEKFIKQILSEHAKSQTLNIYVSPQHLEQIETRLKETLERMRRKTSCTLLADSALDALECRFEWTGGGAEWNPAPIAQNIIQTIAKHLPDHLKASFKANPQGIDETAQTPHNEPQITGQITRETP